VRLRPRVAAAYFGARAVGADPVEAVQGLLEREGRPCSATTARNWIQLVREELPAQPKLTTREADDLRSALRRHRQEGVPLEDSLPGLCDNAIRGRLAVQLLEEVHELSAADAAELRRLV
jgi:hypothetical protein